MSQDLRRERQAANVRIGNGVHLYDGDTPIGMMLTADWTVRVVEALKNAKYWQDMSTGQTTRNAELVEQLHAAKARNEQLQLRLNQQIDMEQETSLRLRLSDYLDNLDRNAGEDELAAERSFSGGTAPLADQLFSQFQAANRARVTRKVVKGVREILDAAQTQPSVRYWSRHFAGEDFTEYYKFAAGYNAPRFWYFVEGDWLPSHNFQTLSSLAQHSDTREIAAADLPEGVAP